MYPHPPPLHPPPLGAERKSGGGGSTETSIPPLNCRKGRSSPATNSLGQSQRVHALPIIAQEISLLADPCAHAREQRQSPQSGEGWEEAGSQN